MNLDLLKPTRAQRIMDLVAKAGVDVSSWAQHQNGSLVRSPAANPRYCYEWAFGGASEPTVLCVWHRSLQADGETVFFTDNLREFALQLEQTASGRRDFRDVGSRSETQARRARQFDLKVQHAYRRRQSVRLVLLAGREHDVSEPGFGSSKVDFRELDPAPWQIVSYDDHTGAFRLERDVDPHELTEADRAFDKISSLSPEAFADALSEIDADISGTQREMLIGHATAPGRTLSMEKIGVLAGYAYFGTANLQYGKLGGMLAAALGVSRLANKVQSICFLAEKRDEEGHQQWTIREQVFDALKSLDLVPSGELAADSSLASVDEAEGETPTQRKALIDARLGQGVYRRKMLRWWGNACALTGCTVEAALIASHAVAWRSCSSSRERLDHFNGLLLVGTLDRLFDAGLIGFSAAGDLLISTSLSAADREALGLGENMKLRKTDPRMAPYLERHRKRYRL